MFEKKRGQSNGIYTNGIYTNMILTRKVYLPFNTIGSNVKEIIEKNIVSNIEGKCDVDGFIKNNSCVVKTFSSGVIKGNNIVFDVVFECMVCSPVEGMIIPCIVKSITKAGVRAELNEDPSPIVVFIARDHNNKNPVFNKLTVDEHINIKVIGTRFELNDKFISIIANIHEGIRKKKPKITIQGEDFE